VILVKSTNRAIEIREAQQNVNADFQTLFSPKISDASYGVLAQNHRINIFYYKILRLNILKMK
jgi:hypothetical protein